MSNDGYGGPTTPSGSFPGTLVDPLSLETELEVCQYVREALGRFGSGGRVAIADGELWLDAVAATTHVPLPAWLGRWDQLDETTRRNRTQDLARQLAQPRAISQATSRRPGAFNLTRVAAVLALAVAGSAAYFWFSHAPSDHATAAPPVDPRTLDANRERDARDARVCEATRSRVLRGATVGITETDGWVVEFYGFSAAAAAPLVQHPRLGEFVQDPKNPRGSAYIWKDEPELATVIDSSTLVTLADEIIEGSAGQRQSALRVTFHGNLVEPYFDADRRPRFYHIAYGLMNALGLSHGGLYARCATGSTHHIGSWFRGESDAAAASALLYILGTYAEPPHLAPNFLHAPGKDALDRSVALENIEHNAHDVDRALLAGILGRQGGMITGKASEGVTIVFSYRDGNRASRASRELARLLKLNHD